MNSTVYQKDNSSWLDGITAEKQGWLTFKTGVIHHINKPCKLLEENIGINLVIMGKAKIS